MKWKLIAFGFLACQALPSQEADPQIRKVLQEVEVVLQGGGGLGAYIEKLQPMTSAESRVALAYAYLQAGRTDEMRRVLVQLSRGADPARAWAKSQLAATEGKQDKPGSGSQLLDKLVRDLDGVPATRKTATVELRRLGGLAVPAILKGLPKLGPVGTQLSFELMMPHVNDQVIAAMRKMIEGGGSDRADRRRVFCSAAARCGSD